VDYEEELSALYGPYLNQQTHFLMHSIERILECYKYSKNKPTSVIAIGHSMGGLVIRDLLSMPTFEQRKINVVINLATPQNEPPIQLDQYIHEYYARVNSIWRQNQNKRFENITFLSLGGGFRDYLVRSDLSLFQTGVSNHISMLTTSLQRIWLSNDHQCIVWCNQLVRALTRTFFRMVDQKTKQISTNPKFRSKVLKQTLFFMEMGTHKVRERFENCQILESDTLQTVDGSGCFRIPRIEKNQVIDIWLKSEELENTLFRCTNTDSCKCLIYETQVNSLRISQFSTLTRLNDTFHVFRSDIKKQFLIQTRTLLDKKHNSFRLPLISSTSLTFPFKDRFYTVIYFSGFWAPWQAFVINLSTNTYLTTFEKELIVQVKNQETRETRVFLFQPGTPIRFHLKLFTVSRKKNVELHIWTEAKSPEMILKIAPDFTSSLGQLTRFHMETMLRYTIVLHLMRNIIPNRMKTFLCGFAVVKSCYLQEFDLIPILVTKVLPEIYLLTVAYSVSTLTSMVSVVALELSYFMLYIPRRFVLNQNFRLLKMKITYVAVMKVLFMMFVYKLLGSAFVVITCMIVHVIQLNVNGCQSNERRNSILYSDFNAFFPITVLFSAVPILTSVKDLFAGFGFNSAGFHNLDILGLVYTLYWVVHQHGAMESSTKFRFSDKILYLKASLCVLFMLREFVEFFNIVYLNVLCMLLRSFASFLKSKKE